MSSYLHNTILFPLGMEPLGGENKTIPEYCWCKIFIIHRTCCKCCGKTIKEYTENLTSYPPDEDNYIELSPVVKVLLWQDTCTSCNSWWGQFKRFINNQRRKHGDANMGFDLI